MTEQPKSPFQKPSDATELKPHVTVVVPGRTVLRGRMVLPTVVVPDGVVVVDKDRITYAGGTANAPISVFDLPDAAPDTYLLPGLVDVHNHGGGGFSFPDAVTRSDVSGAVAAHAAQGTTSVVASLVTAPADRLLAGLALLADAADAGEIAGIHLEGPLLSRERSGAQSTADLLDGDVGLVRELVEAARGHLRVMTVAPEVPGVLGRGGVAEALVKAGVIPSLGHTSGTCEQAEALIAQVAPALRERGLTMTATHLFNGMPPLHHRDPGPVAACLAAASRGRMVVELVADGVHLAPATIRSMVTALDADNVVLVTDAMAAAGMPDGRYTLGPVDVEVHDGVARLASGGVDATGGPGVIAGGTSRLLDVVRVTVAAGVPLVDAVRAASWIPTDALGLKDMGRLQAGRRADVVVADSDLKPVRVLKAGVDVGLPAGDPGVKE